MMRDLVEFELRKMLARPIVVVVLLVMLSIDCMTVFSDVQGGIVSLAEVAAQQTEQSQYAGKIDQQWTAAVQARMNRLVNTPANLMSLKEQDQVRRRYLQQGYTQDYVDHLPNAVFLKTDVTDGLPYRTLAGAINAGEFYEHARRYAASLAQEYRTAYPGGKGNVLAAKAEAMYGRLATRYTAYYGYNAGWNKLLAMQRLLPFTVGVLLLIMISPVFAGEYSEKMDSLVLSSRYGRSSVAHAKIAASFVLASMLWLSVQLLNLLLVAWTFSLAGARTFVQDWQFNCCPFAVTQLTNYLAVCALSFTGMLLFATVILIVSVNAKSPFVALLVSGVFLVLPVIGDLTQVGGFLLKLPLFAPAVVLIAVDHVAVFIAYDVFGHAVLMQYVVPAVMLTASGSLLPFVPQVFQRHQAEN